MPSSVPQFVTMVASGGTPVRLADQTGAPLPTTGQGALVFGTNPVLKSTMAAVAIASDNTLTLDLATTQCFNVTVDKDLDSQTFLNALSGYLNVIIIQFTGNGTAYSQTWTGWQWLTGTPILSSDLGKHDLAVIFSTDGLSFYAKMYAQNF